MKLARLLGPLLAAACVAACEHEPAPAGSGAIAAPGSAEPLRVGMEIAYVPFEFMGKDGTTPEGFDVDLVKALGAHLGREVKCVNLAFDVLIDEVNSGRIDVICSGMSATDLRAQTVDFSRPYASSPMWVLVNVERAKNVTALAGLEGANIQIAVQRGTTGEKKARARYPNAKFLVFDKQTEAGDTVSTGRADAFVYDKMSIEQLHTEHPDTTRILPGDLGTETYCMAFKKGSPLRKSVDEFLAEATRPGGKVDELLKKWVPAWEQYRVQDR